MFYKYGGKQLYYNNTFDGQGEIDINKEDKLPDLEAGELKMTKIARVVKFNGCT